MFKGEVEFSLASPFAFTQSIFMNSFVDFSPGSTGSYGRRAKLWWLWNRPSLPTACRIRKIKKQL